MKVARKALAQWRVAFVLVAVVFAVQYLKDGMSDNGASGDTIKGVVWAGLAIVGTVLEVLRRRANRNREKRSTTTVG